MNPADLQPISQSASNYTGAPKRRRSLLLWLAIIVVAGLGVLLLTQSLRDYLSAESRVPGGVPVSISQQLGIEALAAELGADMPTGLGVVTGHVETRQNNHYLPAATASRFEGVTFHPRSGPSKSSGHASATATIIYGPKGLAPGISQVECFATNHWLSDGFLHALSDREPDIAAPIRLFNNSWVSYDRFAANDILQRIDQVIDEQRVLVVAAVNNGRTTKVPEVLASAYNVIAVGDWDGNSSSGYTSDESGMVPGRSKPDLVAPGGLTSFATPGVAAMAARLMEKADDLAMDRAMQPLVIKAVLMAGADKPGDWQQQPGHPLDEHYGAGRPRLDHSYDMLIHPLKKNELPGVASWDYQNIDPSDARSYRLLLEKPVKSISAILTWHRRVQSQLSFSAIGRDLVREYTSRMATMNLTLLRSDRMMFESLASSDSPVDNVQHVYLRDLPAGRYDLVINRVDALDETWDYAVAWQVIYDEGSASSDQR